jgi:cytochrome c553
MRNPTPLVVHALAAVIATLAALPARAQMDAAQMAATRQKAEVCFACHGPNGNSVNPAFPVLAGQSWRCTYIQLKNFKEWRRTNDAGNMTSVAGTLSDEDIENLAHYIANLN